MINLNYLKAKIKQNKLDVYAGKYFVNENSKIIKILNDLDKKVLIGIQKNELTYTILGEDKVYFPRWRENK